MKWTFNIIKKAIPGGQLFLPDVKIPLDLKPRINIPSMLDKRGLNPRQYLPLPRKGEGVAQ